MNEVHTLTVVIASQSAMLAKIVSKTLRAMPAPALSPPMPIVCVFPEPVCPYAMTLPLYPCNTPPTISFTCASYVTASSSSLPLETPSYVN